MTVLATLLTTVHHVASYYAILASMCSKYKTIKNAELDA
jgi:hypothetical protein